MWPVVFLDPLIGQCTRGKPSVKSKSNTVYVRLTKALILFNEYEKIASKYLMTNKNRQGTILWQNFRKNVYTWGLC